MNVRTVLELESVSCPRCGSKESARLFQGQDHLYGVPGTFTVTECSSCALQFQNPRPTPATLSLAYPTSYTPHASGADLIDPPLEPRVMSFLRDELGYRTLPVLPRATARWWAQWRVNVDLLPRFVVGGSLLEIGAATGARLRGLRALGWTDLRGIEMVDAAAAVARQSGFDVTTEPVESAIASIPDASLDVVIASFVLEHLYDPFRVVAEIGRVLKPGGELLFATITRDSIDARIWRQWWAGYDLPRHMVYFNDRDLHRMTTAHFEWTAEARHDAIQDYARAAWWRLMDHRNLTDRIVGRLAKNRTGAWISRALAWSGLTCRISVRCRRLG